MVLKQIRENVGYSQQELADKASVSRVSISRYETGKRSIPVPIAKRIAEALGIKWERLFDR